MTVEAYLETLRGSPSFMQNVTQWRVLPERPARYGSFSSALDRRIIEVLHARGIDQPYIHQSEAIEKALAGEDFVVVTPTASGKTLCYNVPVLHSILQNEASRALYLYPTKALSSDQVAELYSMIEAMGV
ncbi:MAG: DEAD/DEAH box helicase, partial [Clostridia bacterium]|nr:DEAD/DEAH box helicase [Clostridia bacterium]